jgi:hypothetical protein
MPGREPSFRFARLSFLIARQKSLRDQNSTGVAPDERVNFITAHQPTHYPTMKPALLALLAVTSLASVSCSGISVPSTNQTYNGKSVLTRASHPSGGSMTEVKGVYLGRRYYHPPGGKTGLAWIDVYGQR